MESEDPVATAIAYKEAAYKAYEESLWELTTKKNVLVFAIQVA